MYKLSFIVFNFYLGLGASSRLFEIIDKHPEIPISGISQHLESEFGSRTKASNLNPFECFC